MLRGLYYGDSVFSHMRKQTFMNNYHTIVSRLVDNNRGTIKISALNEDPSVILGYSVLSSDYRALYFIFVKKSWRKIGIAKDLVPDTIKYVTHLTAVGAAIAKNKNLEYNPFIQ